MIKIKDTKYKVDPRSQLKPRLLRVSSNRFQWTPWVDFIPITDDKKGNTMI